MTLENQGTRGKGLAAETVTINLVLPTGASVVSNTGDGYQGVKKLMVTIPPAPAGRGAAPAGGGAPAPAPAPAPPAAPQQVMADVAVWQVPSIPAGTKRGLLGHSLWCGCSGGRVPGINREMVEARAEESAGQPGGARWRIHRTRTMSRT